MNRDFADLGTPSAPPIIDIQNDERSTEFENQNLGVPGIQAENDQFDNGTSPSRESVGFDGVEESLANWKTGYLNIPEVGDRYGKKNC